MNLLLIALTLIVIVIDLCTTSCIHHHPNSTIDYISQNINIDESIYYLGNKISTNECQNSCIHLNYLCDTSSRHILYNHPDDDHFLLNDEQCSITASVPNGASIGSTVLLTSDLVSNEYILEAQVSITSGEEAGITFKATKQYDNIIDLYYDYYFAPSAKHDETVAGYTIGETFNDVNSKAIPSEIPYNTKLNITVHVINTTFTAYLNEEKIFTNSKQGEEIDESIFTKSYAGIYSYRSNAIFHSYKVRFPNHIDNIDTRFCSAFVYNKDNGDCYGYYGDDYVMIDESVSIDTQSIYDSGILYDTTTCAPTDSPVVTTEQTPSQDPTTIPTVNPTKFPTMNPSKFVITKSSPFPTINPSQFPTINPSKFPTINPSKFPTINPSKFVTTKSSPFPTINPNEFPPTDATYALTENSITELPLHPELTLVTDVEEESNVKKKLSSNLVIFIVAVVVTLVAITVAYLLYKYIGCKKQDAQQMIEVMAAKTDPKLVDEHLDTNPAAALTTAVIEKKNNGILDEKQNAEKGDNRKMNVVDDDDSDSDSLYDAGRPSLAQMQSPGAEESKHKAQHSESLYNYNGNETTTTGGNNEAAEGEQPYIEDNEVTER